MTSDDELKSAQRLRDEAEAKLRQATEKEQRAEYLIGQAEHRRREIAQIEASVAQREQRLTAGGIADLDRREKAAAKALADAKALMADFNKERHEAAVNLNWLIERDKRELAEAGIGN